MHTRARGERGRGGAVDGVDTAQLYVDTGTSYDVPFGHPFAGYYLAYPDAKYSGLVSTITDDAPIMNWIYVDRNTHEVKFGIRQFAEANLTGPFDCTRQDRRLTFGGWEGFVAVQEGDFWALYFDRDGDNLRAKVAPGTPVLELELLRRELRMAKPPTPPPPEPPNGEQGGEEGEKGREQGEQGEQGQQTQHGEQGQQGQQVPVHADDGDNGRVGRAETADGIGSAARHGD